MLGEWKKESAEIKEEIGRMMVFNNRAQIAPWEKDSHDITSTILITLERINARIDKLDMWRDK